MDGYEVGVERDLTSREHLAAGQTALPGAWAARSIVGIVVLTGLSFQLGRSLGTHSPVLLRGRLGWGRSLGGQEIAWELTYKM